MTKNAHAFCTRRKNLFRGISSNWPKHIVKLLQGDLKKKKSAGQLLSASIGSAGIAREPEITMCEPITDYMLIKCNANYDAKRGQKSAEK